MTTGCGRRVYKVTLPDAAFSFPTYRYKMHDNFFVYGGHKSDFDGHGKLSFRNINAYSLVYGAYCMSIMSLPHASADGHYNEGYYNNT